MSGGTAVSPRSPVIAVLVGLGIGVIASHEGCLSESPAEILERREAQANLDDRIEVLIWPGLAFAWSGSSPYAQYKIPHYVRDRVTGLCFAMVLGEGTSGLAEVPCSVVEGARQRLLAAGWKLGEIPTVPRARP